MDLTRFPEADRAPIRAALDSFPRFYQERTVAESVSHSGDTVIVSLIEASGAAHPESWDGPRLYVWVLRPARIIRSSQWTNVPKPAP